MRTRIILLCAVNGDTVLTVAAAKQLAYLIRAVYRHVCSRRSSRVAAAINLADAGLTAAVYYHQSGCVSV